MAVAIRGETVAAIDRAAERLAATTSLVAITGAGVSAESGIPTFRGEGGLWNGYRAEELATPAAFAANPQRVWEWYLWRRGIVAKADPNPGHATLAVWEQRVADFTLITQNVDGLHQRAGNTDPVEVHGNIWRARCIQQGHLVDQVGVTAFDTLPPRCHCGSWLRPDIVWFGEPLPGVALNRAEAALQRADTVVVIGTSGVVYPVAEFPRIAKQAGAFVVEINPEPTPLSPLCDEVLRGGAATVLPELERLVTNAQ